MNHAVIDLGSNTIHLLVFGFEDGRVTKVLSEKDVTGLAGYIKDGVLNIDGIMKACEIVNIFRQHALEIVAPSDIHLFATASLRNVKNSKEAVDIIMKETSLVPDVLEGEEEGRLGFIGAKMSVECDDGILVDIGGASTELVVFKNGKIKKIASMPIGSLLLYMRHVNDAVPNGDEREDIENDADEHLSMIGWDDIRIKRMVGIGGTLRAVQKLIRVFFDVDEKGDIDAGLIKELIKMLKDRDGDAYRKMCDTIPERAKTIFPGLIILKQVIRRFGCDTVTISRSGLRDGYFWNRVLKNE